MQSFAMRLVRPHLVLALVAVLAAGCAAALPGASPTPPKAPPPDTAGSYQAGAYTLSNAERGLDCKKLTGRMQLRILQIRGADERPTTSSVSRATQSVVAPVLGGSTYGADPKAQVARDRAVLVAYNEELKRKGCPAFDLETELASTDVRRTPRPVMPPPAAKQ